MRALLLSMIFIISFISVSTKALIVLALVKEASETSLQINTIFNVQTKESTVELNRLTLLLCYMDIQEISREDIAEFNFLGIIRQSKRSWRAHF